MVHKEASRPARWGMVVVLLVAALLRLAALPDLPLGLHYDEAANLILTRQIAEEGYRPVFIRAYTGKEPLFFYIAAPWVRMAGGDPWGIRLAAAMIGIVTVAATYAAVRALFADRPERGEIALFAAGWIAIAFPHVLLSRYGFRAISQPLLQALTVALLWRGLRLERPLWLVAAGLALGLTGTTYLAARLFPLPMALALAVMIVRASPPVRRRRLGQIAIVMVAAALAFAPLGLFFVRNPETFMTRITQVAAPSWQDALRGIWLCLRALVWPGSGDGYIRFNAPGAPVMRPLAALLAVLGLARILATPRVSVMDTAGRLLVVLGTLAMILPSALATGEITPSNLRMVGVLPFLAVLPAWGLSWLAGRLLRPLWLVPEGLGRRPAPTAEADLNPNPDLFRPVSDRAGAGHGATPAPTTEAESDFNPNPDSFRPVSDRAGAGRDEAPAPTTKVELESFRPVSDRAGLAQLLHPRIGEGHGRRPAPTAEADLNPNPDPFRPVSDRAGAGHGATPAPTTKTAAIPILLALFVAGAALTAIQYRGWAASAALFRAADGEMVLAAEALDAAVSLGTTVTIASEHYRHPTVAALATHYADAKWLTGGATLVLPPEGDAVTVVPDSQTPPVPWPADLAAAGQRSRLTGPAGEVGVTLVHLAAAELEDLRADLRAGGPAADFAHVVWTYDATPAVPCRAGEPCLVIVIWEPRAPYGALQPVVRLTHPETGEWARTMAFHYPPEQWALGDLVIDQLVLDLPVEMPPGDGYRLEVGAYDPDRDVALPRLVDEQFAGFEVVLPRGEAAFAVAPAPAAPSATVVAAACPGVPRSGVRVGEGLDLLGATVTADPALLPGSPLTVRLCWQATVDAPAFERLWLTLSATDREARLYTGTPAEGYGFDRWRAGEVIETRHPVRIPRDVPSGSAALRLQLDDGPPVVIDTVEVTPVTRRFAVPEPSHRVGADFAGAAGAEIRLVGYELSLDDDTGALTVMLVWQALAELDEDYVVFLHLRDTAGDVLLAQVDEMPQSREATAAGRYPTSVWVQGEVVTDTHTVPLPPEARSAPSALYVGLYLPSNGLHLTVDGSSRLELASTSEILP